MAAIFTTAHVSIFAPSLNSTPLKHHKRAPRCALPSQKWTESRRLVSISLVLLHSLSSLPPYANAATSNLFDRYVKRKKLEPLETYVPAVILTQLQIKDIEDSLEVDQPQYDIYRSVLRSGPAASFRSNIRAVAEYASDGGQGKAAFDDVERCLRAVDELDSLLLRASRNNKGASVKLMKEKITTAVNALNSLLKTVPTDVLDKANAIADSYRNPESNDVPQELDQDLKELQSIL
ncbi:hypothetical protein SOVF_122680 [Spinacia oleracea]|uniref:DUF7880 domain-containing protein n=1 Tax=Spinacia oleracea TaxID=3562 RepID=A0A9R0IWX3_SPIOL|nr:uncharacterized protein LOC110795099 [Spinacia oleracea]KNA12797.1 hypothetical protein SOVF_122680 [Spinacia oleracea]